MRQARILELEAAPVRARLRRPFVTALGRREETVNVGLTLRLAGGAWGYGEASTSLAQKHLGPARLASALRALARRFRGRPAEDYGALIEEAWRACGPASPAAAAFECALLGALCRSRGLSLFEWFGAKRRRAETDLTISAVGPAGAGEAAAEAAAEGFRTLKVKLSGSADDDLARLRAVRRAAPRARLLLDGNQGFSESAALRLVERCLRERMPLELFEQPVPKDQPRALSRLGRRCPIPVAADESCATPEDAARLAELGGVGVFNIKLAKSGIARSLAIAAVARGAGLRLMIGCMAETARGLSASVHLALGTGFFAWHDLDSDRLLAGGPAPEGWSRQGAAIRVTREGGTERAAGGANASDAASRPASRRFRTDEAPSAPCPGGSRTRSRRADARAR